MDGRRMRAAGASLVAVGLLGLAASPALAAPTVSVSTLSSLKTGAKAGTLSGSVHNDTAAARSAKVTVRLMRSGVKARVVGTTTVSVPPKAVADYSVKVALPSGLSRGNYYLSACTPKGDGDPGAMDCATAAKDLLIGGGIPVRGPEAMKPYLRAKATAHSAAAETCSSGAHTLAKPGTRVWPELGNGGYLSLHTDIYTVYDAAANVFLPGNHVEHTQRSTQCLTDFSYDFDAKNGVTSTSAPGPDMTVTSITVNGQPATFKQVQPTYPGDPNGQDDPDQRGQPEPARLCVDQLERHDGEPALLPDQARDHAGHADPERDRLQGRRQLRRPPGRAPEPVARQRGLVPQRQPDG
jgi:hypothetical protein